MHGLVQTASVEVILHLLQNRKRELLLLANIELLVKESTIRLIRRSRDPLKQWDRFFP
ncbi:hypothetical protein D3C85_1667460 [compost metagenome]